MANWLAVSLPMLIAMECPHKDADAGHLRGLHATLPASPPSPLLTAVNYEQAREKNLLCFWLILAKKRLILWLTVRAHKDCLFNCLTKNNLQAREE